MSKVPSLLTLSAVLCAGAAFAEGESVYRVVDDTTLEVTVPAGFTNEFDATYAEALNANTYTALVKKGDGGLYMPMDISSYVGTVEVVAGSLGCCKATSLGVLSPSAGEVRVDEGATLFIPDNRTDSRVTVNTVNLSGKRLFLAGLGVDGAGAFDLRSEQQNTPLGTNITLTADARVRNRTQYYWGQKPEIMTYVDMGGHKLYLYSEGSVPAFRYVDISNPGHIEMEGKSMLITGTKFGGSAENTLTLPGVSEDSIQFSDSSAYAPKWTLIRKTCSSLTYLRSAQVSWTRETDWSGVSTNRSSWLGPVLFDGLSTEQVNIQSPTRLNGGMALLGKVSGAPKIRVWGNHLFDNNDSYHHPYLNLVNPENDFTGDVILRFGGLRLWNPGALPADVKLKLEEGEVAFDNLREDFGMLPEMTVDGSVTVQAKGSATMTNDVRFGRGTWKSVTKTGPERLLWYSGTGAKVVDLQEGFLKLGRRPKIAGLYSSLTNDYSGGVMSTFYKNGTSLELDLEPGVRAPNDKAHAYHNYTYKLIPTKSGDSQYAVVDYHGYVWNNSATNETWSFAGGGIGRACRLEINDVVVFEFDVDCKDGSVSTRLFGHGDAVLHPGPNKFSYRGYRLYRADGTSISPESGWTWNDSFRFAYDPLGRGSKNMADYERMEDPGDGSLFTFCLPEEEYSYPGHADEKHVGVQTDFGLVKFADGTGLDLTDVTNYVANSIQGYPILKNATAFGITNRWTVGVETLGAKKLTTDGTLDLSQATIVVDESKAKMGRGSLDFEIATAAGGIVGTPEVIGVERCSTRLSADGKTLCLHHEPKGALLIIR